MKNIFASLFAIICSLTTIVAQGQPAENVTVFGEGYANKPIPIAMSGFSGEVNSVLRFDLEIAGFQFVDTDKAQYQVTGNNNTRVEGALTELVGRKNLFSRAYAGSPRAGAHALANDIIFAVTGKKGIAGTKVAFRVDKGNSSEVYVADYDGHNATPVTADNSEVMTPAWVPGQRKLLYCSRKNGPIQIFSQDLNSGARKLVAGFSSSSYSPAISPDGRRVAMILSKSGSPDLYVADIDGGNLKQLTQTKEDESSPCWSPDGSKICFVGRSGTRAALFTISANGGSRKQISVGGSLNLTEPDWSPDGKQIVFTRMMGNFEVCVVPATGGTATVLVSGEDPSWAPNSRTVIFTRRQNNKRVLSLLDVPTKRVKDVAQISGSSSQASWSK